MQVHFIFQLMVLKTLILLVINILAANFGFAQTLELLENPNFSLSMDEAKFQAFMKKEKIPANVLTLKAKNLLAFKDKLANIPQVGFFSVREWEILGSSNPDANFLNTQKVNDGQCLLSLGANKQNSQGEFAFTTLKLPLQKGLKYQIRIRYKWLTDSTLGTKNLPKLGFVFLRKSPEKLVYNSNDLKVDFEINYHSNRASKMKETRRKKVIQDFQANYGGVYQADFAQLEPIQEWQEASFTYVAEGMEQFLLLGNLVKTSKKSIINLVCSLDYISVKPSRPDYTHDAGLKENEED